MDSEQSKTLCRLFGTNPDEAVGEEPRYIAVQRVFDDKAADKAKDEHDHYWTNPKPAPKVTGTATKTLMVPKGGAK